MFRNGVIVEMTTDYDALRAAKRQLAAAAGATGRATVGTQQNLKHFAKETENEEVRAFEDHHRDFIILLKKSSAEVSDS